MLQRKVRTMLLVYIGIIGQTWSIVTWTKWSIGLNWMLHQRGVYLHLIKYDKCGCIVRDGAGWCVILLGYWFLDPVAPRSFVSPPLHPAITSAKLLFPTFLILTKVPSFALHHPNVKHSSVSKFNYRNHL